VSAGHPLQRKQPPSVSNPEEIGQRLTEQLNRAGLDGTFSEGAIETLWEAQSLYIERIVSEAIYQAKSNEDENVQAKHIRRAVGTYFGGRSTVSKALEPLGGVLAGAGASQALSIVVSAAARTTLSIVITLVLIVFGVSILAVALAYSWRRRDV
jgi:hypothetical protein